MWDDPITALQMPDSSDNIQALNYRPYNPKESIVGIISSFVDKGVDTYAQVENIKARTQEALRPLERQQALFNNPRLNTGTGISPQMKKNLMIGGGVVVGLVILSKVL